MTKSRKSKNRAEAISSYVGRFAPSPTGPLHLGSLICALASYLDARNNQGRWLVRIEDIDPPREQPGAAHTILRSLEYHGLHWDGPVIWQSEQRSLHEETMQQLVLSKRAFRCNCSRQMLAASDGIYNGHCRELNLDKTAEHAVRLRVSESSHITVKDDLQPPLEQNLETEVGDFIIWRRDGLPAYQLAVVVDDADQGITDIVRGYDLYDSTPRQIYLQHALGLQLPRYMHIPVISNETGQKLSKQNHAPAIDNTSAADNLRLALRFLNQEHKLVGPVSAILEAAVENWQPDRIPASAAIPQSSLA